VDCAAAAKALTARHPNGNVFYTECDVSGDPKSCDALGKFAKDKLGNIGKTNDD
jgi:hypothetical protein